MYNNARGGGLGLDNGTGHHRRLPGHRDGLRWANCSASRVCARALRAWLLDICETIHDAGTKDGCAGVPLTSCGVMPYSGWPDGLVVMVRYQMPPSMALALTHEKELLPRYGKLCRTHCIKRSVWPVSGAVGEPQVCKLVKGQTALGCGNIHIHPPG